MGLAAGAMACALAIGAGPQLALAVEGGDYTVPSSSPSSQAQAPATEEKLPVDELAEAYETAKVDKLVANVKAYAMQQRVDVLEAVRPAQQELSDKAARSLYKNQRNKYNIADLMLSAQTLDEFVRQAKYYDSITRSNLAELDRLKELDESAASAKEGIESTLAQADEAAAAAEEALTAAQKERADKAAEGIAKSQAQAAVLGGAVSVGKDGNGNSQGNFKMAATDDDSALDDGANWYSTREEFIAEWAPRIDAYFEGSPLYGQGANFAKSAWKYCIDPRWSAAISNTESSKARVCIRKHNAWGWGAADSDPYNLAAEWDTWEEAIDAHARGLANGYGYTISIKGAKKYCPYTWQSWYNRTLSEMAKI